MRWRHLGSAGILLLVLLVPHFVTAGLPITSPFGWRIHPISGTWRFHSGVDLGYNEGTPVPAMFDGTVVQAGNFGDGYGNQILLYHPASDTYTRYAHLSGIVIDADTYVTQGTIIGYVGSTGNATGPHLHLEYIVRDGDSYVYADPLVLWQ